MFFSFTVGNYEAATNRSVNKYSRSLAVVILSFASVHLLDLPITKSG